MGECFCVGEVIDRDYLNISVTDARPEKIAADPSKSVNGNP
jgi:hypothetical protein